MAGFVSSVAVGLERIANSVAVLRTCEALLPATEDVKLVARLIAVITNCVYILQGAARVRADF
jgi:hypothetical protein